MIKEYNQSIFKAILWNIIPILLAILITFLLSSLRTSDNSTIRTKLEKMEQMAQKNRVNQIMVNRTMAKADSSFAILLKTYDLYFSALDRKSVETASLLSQLEQQRGNLHTLLITTITRLNLSDNKNLCEQVLHQYRQRLNFLHAVYQKTREENIGSKNASEDLHAYSQENKDLEEKLETLRAENMDLKNQNQLCELELKLCK